MTHTELCQIAAKYLKSKGIVKFQKCKYVVIELERVGECPDAFGWNSETTQLIEAKMSRADFLSDKKKFWRKNPDYGLGMYRSFLCPVGVINTSDLPEYWGLLWYDIDDTIYEVRPPFEQKCNHRAEIGLITSIMRREGIKSKIFSYKKYKSNE